MVNKAIKAFKSMCEHIILIHRCRVCSRYLNTGKTFIVCRRVPNYVADRDLRDYCRRNGGQLREQRRFYKSGPCPRCMDESRRERRLYPDIGFSGWDMLEAARRDRWRYAFC